MPRTRDELVKELIELIVDAVNLQHIDQSTLGAETSFVARKPDTTFSEPQSPLVDAQSSQARACLGLDSVDMLEAVVAVENRYGVKIENGKVAESIFRNFGTLADFVMSKQ